MLVTLHKYTLVNHNIETPKLECTVQFFNSPKIIYSTTSEYANIFNAESVKLYSHYKIYYINE